MYLGNCCGEHGDVSHGITLKFVMVNMGMVALLGILVMKVRGVGGRDVSDLSVG